MTKEQIDNLEEGEVLLIDIREDDEVAENPSLPNAIHIPMLKVIDKVNEGSLANDKKIVTVCRSGRRCSILNEFLGQKGFETDLLEGGMKGVAV